MNWIKKLWYARLRRIDMEILWPSCLAHGSDIQQAKKAFAVHAYNDPAWLFLGENVIYEIIEHLGE